MLRPEQGCEVTPVAWVVIEVMPESASPVPKKVRSWGPYNSKDQAEQARRRIHLDNRLAAGSGLVHLPKTYVSELTK